MRTSILFMAGITSDLQRDEGFQAHPYKCTAGTLSIGYGRNLDDVGISKAEAEILLRNDILKAQGDLDRIFPLTASSLSNNCYKVLVNMIFNLGATRFLTFRKMRKAVEEGDFERAADEMLDSLWARQVGLRAERLAQLMRDGR